MPKGNFSCHSFTEQGRENYETIFRKRKRHQEISNEVEAMKTPKAHESAVEYKDVKEEENPGRYKGLKRRLSLQAPHLTEEEIELTAYDMMVEQGMEKN